MIVVADTSVLLNLCRVGQIDLLQALFHEILVPPEVANEFARLSSATGRFQGLTFPVWIRQQTSTNQILIPATLNLHPGEIAALSLAVEVKADAILIDERSGHTAALRLGLKTIGILGILIQAKASGNVPSIRPIIERLEREARFWLGPSLRNRVLKQAGE